MNKVDKLIALKEAAELYINMCKEIVEKEFSEDNVTLKDLIKSKESTYKVISDIKDISYLKELNKDILKISIIDRSKMDTLIRDNKLYLTLSK